MKISTKLCFDRSATLVLEQIKAKEAEKIGGVKSLVDIWFPARNMTLSYYNDQFDLAPGDLVYVEGKLEGKPGRVVKVSRQFKIKLSDYKRVIAKVDTQVRGRLDLLGSHVVAFDRDTIPYSKVLSWFKAPGFEEAEEEYVTGDGVGGFPLDDLSEMDIRPEIAERGLNYYQENRVSYLSLDGIHGKAIVEGTQPYVLEFEYIDGEICGLACDCYCYYCCKHEFAAMLQLRETLDMIEEHYGAQYAASGYFAALSKPAFTKFVLDRMQTGHFDLY